MLLECGSGVFGQLKQRHDYTAVDAVLITHLHADHMLDLVPYAYALSLSPRVAEAGETRPRPALYGPPGSRQAWNQIVSAWGGEGLIDSAFHCSEYDPSQTLRIGSLQARLCPVPHFAPTYAVELAAAAGQGGRFVFGADCAPNQAIVDFARAAELLMLEATITVPEPTGQRGHLTAAEAGAHARAAAAKRLVLTHFSDELDRQALQASANCTFGGEVELAHVGACYTV